MFVVYRERHFLDRYRCIDYEVKRPFNKAWGADGTSLIYFRRGFDTFSVGKDEIIKIEWATVK